jgi:O-antigen/teichoic acid export membrane protein
MSRIITFFWIAYFSKHIGPSLFGNYNIVMSFAGIVLPASTFGVGIIVIRDAVQQPAARRQLFGSLFWIRLTLSVILWAVLLSLFPLYHYPSWLFRCFVLAGIYLLVTTVTQVAEALYIAAQRTEFLWLTQVIAAAAWAALGWTALRITGSLTWVFCAMAVAAIVAALFHIQLIGRFFEMPDFSFKPRLIWREFKEGAPIGAVSIITAGVERLDRILLSFFVVSTAVGYYGLASLLTYTIIDTLWNPFSTVLYPIMSRGAASGTVSLPWLARKGILWTFGFSFLIVGLMLVWAAPVIHRIWGPSYYPAIVLLEVLGPTVPFIALNRFFPNFLFAEHKQHSYMKIKLTTFLLYVAGNLIAIPLWGTLGAAFVLLCIQIIETAIYWIFLRRTMPGFWEPLRLLRVIGLGSICFGPLLLWHGSKLWAMLPAVLYSYLLLFHVFKLEDREILQRWLSHLRQRDAQVI